ncbi:putative E3 ubiquitin-protein ligase UBR7 isoform X2 [Patiria miniata]|uniref:Putative E3 ubiquitin-protein ligase UBR7 n=1 Tax=Patiria miniata TaxID=46514 RepID=A0A914BHY2_PATMI|nr:putative E3 ubiquitin-protein ligase UBR7 isoform X2 [Patiria miniata]
MAESRKEMADEVQQEDNEDTVLSMVDVLQESEELEEEATAVLGDSDDKYCTYPLGYRGRQALYACATCTSASTESAGVCLACSYECHEGHQLYELYTKRNFRCDCGNSKFGSMQCKLIEKDATNPDNKYNQNFRGVYCICNRPYPDPEDEIEDEMIQCVVCEDWFHGRHLGDVRVPESNDYQEMVCAQCMQGACDFLWYYAITSKEVKIEKDESCLDVEVENVAKNQPVSDSGNKEHAEGPATSDTEPYVTSDQKPAALQPAPDHPSTDNATSTDTKNTVPLNEVPPTTENVNPEQSESMTVHQDGKDFDAMQTQAIAAAATVSGGEASTSASTVAATSHNGQRQQEHVAGDVCRLRELKAREVEKKSHATFWPSGWRSKLCTCQDCKMLYESRQVSFLMDEADTVLAYELRGKVKHAGTSQYQMGMEALTTLNRVQQVEVIHEYNDLKASLRDYLQSFANQGKVVKRQDIDEFFSDMQSRKRQRVGVGNPQYFCR